MAKNNKATNCNSTMSKHRQRENEFSIRARQGMASKGKRKVTVSLAPVTFGSAEEKPE